MTRTVIGAIALQQVDVTTLPGTVDHYHVAATSAEGGTASADVPVDSTSVSLTCDPGSWTFIITAVDATGAQLGGAVTATPAPLVVQDVTQVFVNVPSALAVSVAA